MEWVKNYPRSAELAANYNRREKLQALDGMGMQGSVEYDRWRSDIEREYQKALDRLHDNDFYIPEGTAEFFGWYMLPKGRPKKIEFNFLDHIK
jgi:hypothetical protein